MDKGRTKITDEHEMGRALGVESASQRAILGALRTEIDGFVATGRDAELSAATGAGGAHDLRADWVGKDRSGRRVIVGVCEGTDDEAILWSVEAVACAMGVRGPAAKSPTRANRAAGGADRAPLVVSIVGSCSARLLSALSLLPEDAFVLLELRHSAGSGRSKALHARRHPRKEVAGSEPVQRGLDAWPPAARALAESLAARMGRIDPSIERADSDAGMSFLFREDEAALLVLSEGRLVGGCGSETELGAIEDEADADAWVERALRAHCNRLLSGSRPARPLDLLTRSGPLLSAEELAAFRDD